MRRNALIWLAGAALSLAAAAPASAQTGVEMKSTAPAPPKQFDIVRPGPPPSDFSRVPDANFYGEDQRVPYDPAFIEPFVGTARGGRVTYGASAWTSPETPVGSLASQAYHENNGWFGFGITFIWDTAPPAARPAAPR